MFMSNELVMEKYGVRDESTGEIVVDKVAQKKDIIAEGVKVLVSIESLKEQLKDVLEFAKDQGFDKKRLKALIENAFKYELDSKIEELEEVRADFNNLFGAAED